MSNRLTALHNSVHHLADVASRLQPAQFTLPAYPSEWTIADTFSHLGSGAVIGAQIFHNSVRHQENDPHFNATVWDEWNAKEPSVQVSDCLVADRAYLTTLEESTSEQREGFRFNLGPFEFDFEGLLALRLGEHVLHTWDIEVTLEPKATLPNDAANAILDGIAFVAARSGKANGLEKSFTIRSSSPERTFLINCSGANVEFVETSEAHTTDLELSAEQLVRLVYGRLDPHHTDPAISGGVIEKLRTIFPGF